MAPAGQNDQSIRRNGPRRDVDIGAALDAMHGGAGTGGGVEVAFDRQVHHAQDRHAVAHQPDIDVNSPVCSTKLRAVQRIDQPEGVMIAGRRLAGGMLLLRYDRDIGGQVEGRQDDGFGRVVRRRHQAAVRLDVGRDGIGVVAQDDLTGLPRDAFTAGSNLATP